MTSLAQVRPLRTLWLGRERELEELRAGIADLRAGRGSLHLIRGEPGIGKTHLADALAREASRDGVVVRWGRAWEAGGAPSYWPFIQILRSICRGLEAEALEALVGTRGPELAELLPELRGRFGGDAPALVDRFQLFDAVQSLLERAAQRAPQLLVLDDLHAADPSSLLLLSFLARDLRATPLMIVGTYREVEARLGESAAIFARLSRDATVLALRPFERGEVAELVARSTGASPSDERVDALHRQTEGNPLFLRELLQLGGEATRPSEGMREVVRARLALIPTETRAVLEAAAVLGRELDLTPLAAMMGAPELDVVARLGPGADAGVVEPLVARGGWRFTHVVLRDGLYDDLAPARRAALHRAAARALESRVGEPPSAELAHHLLHAIGAVEVGEAADAALRAAERAMHVLAFEDAIGVLARVHERLLHARGEEHRAFEVTLALGTARILAGDVHEGKKDCLRAVDLARALRDGERLARAVIGGACEHVPVVRDEPLIALLTEALAALPPGDGALRARCMAHLAAERQPEPDPEGPIALAREAVAMACRLGDVETERFTRSFAGLAMMTYGDLDERRANDREVLRLALAAADKILAQRAHLLAGGTCLERGDRAGADAHFAEYEALLRLRHERYRWMSSVLRMDELLGAGRFDEAARIWREAEAIWSEDEARGVEWLTFPVGFARAAERYDDLPAIEVRVRKGFAGLGGELARCLGEMWIAHLFARTGDRERLAAQLAAVRAQPIFESLREPTWLALLAEPCHVLGDRALAERLYAAILPRAERFWSAGPFASYPEPPLHRPLGLLALARGRPDDAVAHLERADVLTRTMGYRAFLARIGYELASALLARGAAGDAERAATRLAEARALATELGQVALLPLLDACGVPAPPAPSSEPAMSFAIRREGDYWTVAWGTRTARLRDSRGLQVLDRLVASPGEEHHVLALVGADPDVDRGDAGPVLDAVAMQRYRRRLLDLREELEEAEGFADAGRAERLREEMEILTEELARAVGLGGRARRAAGAAERARTTVQKRLRGAIRRIEEELPELGHHLERSIRTGAFCVYAPDGRPSRR